MTGVEMKPPRRLRLRYPAECVSCGIALSKGADAIWDPSTKTVTCLACSPESEPADPGDAGASAAAEGKRRAERRVEEARRKYGDHAAVVAAAMAEQDAQASWGKGSEGESALARYIDEKVGEEVLALHDRLIPGTRTNIDHLWVTPTGVWVVDAKAYKGKVVRREIGQLWRRDHEVFVAGRNRTALAQRRTTPGRRSRGGPPPGRVASRYRRSRRPLLRRRRVGAARLPVPGGERLGDVPRRPEEAPAEERAARPRAEGANRSPPRAQPPVSRTRLSVSPSTESDPPSGHLVREQHACFPGSGAREFVRDRNRVICVISS